MTIQEKTNVDYLNGLANRVANTDDIRFVTARLRRLIESHDLTQPELINRLGITQEQFVNLAQCLEPAEPTQDDFAALKQISVWVEIELDVLITIWAGEVDPVRREVQSV